MALWNLLMLYPQLKEEAVRPRRNEGQKVEKGKNQKAQCNSEQNGEKGSMMGQHVDTAPRLILHL